jgi:hypothetical protein
MFNVTLNRGYTFALKTAIADTNPLTSIDFTFAANSNRDLDNMPSSGILYHGNEWFYYSNFNKASLIATIMQRGAFGTTAETHAAADVFAYIQNVIILQFGNSTATNPAAGDDTYDDTKPMLDLSSSGELLWVWGADEGFYDPDHPGRTVQWQPYSMGAAQNYYFITKSDSSGDKVMGTMLQWDTGTRVGTSTAGGAHWIFRFGTKIVDSVTTTGLKMKDLGMSELSVYTYYEPKLTSYGQTNIPVDTQLWIEAVPSADGVWHALGTHEDVVIADPYNNEVSYNFYGTLTEQAGANGLYAEVTGVSIVLKDLFTGVTLLTEKSNITMDITLVNETNNDSLGANYPLLANKTISIDSENSVVTYDNFNYHSAIILNDETRPVFIRLQPGVNTIALQGAVGVGSITLSWYARRL